MHQSIDHKRINLTGNKANDAFPRPKRTKKRLSDNLKFIKGACVEGASYTYKSRPDIEQKNKSKAYDI